ncbi:MAG TPA: hypothetical protein VE684_17625 [Crenalkalicoccus sp.]|nr:hypothetical protein [Crenalkalicoccus sp.]
MRKRWGQMPLPALVKALDERSDGKVVSIDDATLPDAASGFSAGPEGKTIDGSLYYDWSADLGD